MRAGIAKLFAIWIIVGILGLFIHHWWLGLIPVAALVYYVIKGIMAIDDGKGYNR